MTIRSPQQSATILYVLACACSTVLISCNKKQDVSMAQSAVDELHNRLKAQEDGQIFAEATPEFQKSMNSETSRAFFAQIRKKLGAPHLSKPISIQVNHMPAGTFILCQFQTIFDKGNAQENITWRLQDGKPRLVGYQVSSPLLLTD